MPTLAEIAKVTNPENIDGLSFLPTLLGKKGQKQHEYLYWEFHELGGRQAIRKGNWKLVRYKVLTPNMTTTELYDLDNDPAENNNLADKHPEIVKELISQMEKSRTPSNVFTFQSTTIIK
jgi:arylsulfatase A-like enzyme